MKLTLKLKRRHGCNRGLWQDRFFLGISIEVMESFTASIIRPGGLRCCLLIHHDSPVLQAEESDEPAEEKAYWDRIRL